LIEWYEDGSLELFDLENDLSEEENLAGESPGRAEMMHGMLEAWRRSVEARMPTSNPRFDPSKDVWK
jgi:hypothetical protein